MKLQHAPKPKRKPKRSTQNKRPRPKTIELYALNKPFNTLCQFTGEAGDTTLANWFPIQNMYPAGRLDKDSEGLLLLTNDGILQARLTEPKGINNAQTREGKVYWVLVEGEPSELVLQQLEAGVELNDGKTQPAKVRRLAEPPQLWPRNPPVRVRQSITDSWLEITLFEGKNRQVRRMTAAVGHPTLRLVRVRHSGIALAGLQPGEWRKVPIDSLPKSLLPPAKK
ncbi:pseudouridine synthase [Aliidiomarina celeris]|uniref:pseudouridine synthase n=1 Tax=Aliidiomarina celeris TaxID=2249428 RepID=UPI000DEB809A|nr:pseudouridine synthase [Aliidiomarina celeris]